PGGDQKAQRGAAGGFVGGSQDRGGGDGRRERRQTRPLEDLAAILGDPELGAEKRLGRRRAEADHDPGTDDLDLLFQPRPAGGDLTGARLLVEPPLALLPPAE